MQKYWLSNPKMTVQVNVNGNRIIFAAPIVSRFINQPLSNLERWMGVKAVPLDKS